MKTAVSLQQQPCLMFEPTPEEAEEMAMKTALKNCKKAVAKEPDNAWAWHQYGEVLLSLKRAEEAVPALRKAVELSPETALFHYHLGLAFYILNQSAAAREQFAGIVADDPELKCAQSVLGLAAMMNLALSQENLGRREEAIQTLLPALDTAVDILFDLGWLHFRAKRYDAALPYAHAAYVLKPNNAKVVHQYGMVLSELKRTREAVKFLQLAVELNPDCCGAWYDLGLAHTRQNHRRKARGYFLRAQEVDPARPWPYYDLACLDALEGNREAAFRNLLIAAERGFRDVRHLQRDKDFRSLRRDARWKELITTIHARENAKN